MSTASKPARRSLGRTLCAAITHATGIANVRNVSLDADHQDVTTIRMEFIATDEQLRAIGEFLEQKLGAGGAA